MRRLLITFAVVPWLLAPIYVQQPDGKVTPLQPNRAPLGTRGGPAATLSSPTVIYVSPTRAAMPPMLPSSTLPMNLSLSPSATTVALPAPVSSSVAPPLLRQGSAEQAAPPPSSGMSPTQAAICVRALSVVQDLAALSMKQSGSQGLSSLTIAATIAQVQAAQGVWPTLQPLKRAGVPFFAPYKAEIKQGLGYADSFCSNPQASSGRVSIPRPR
jgi:hypothetical protein